MHLTAGVWNGRRLLSVRRFTENDEADQRAFANLLRGARNIPVYLMADTLDEDYRFETLPHASGKDRREMLDRKLKQLYRSTPFYGAAIQERESGRRRDDRFLFAALTNPDSLNSWLRILTTSGVPIAGLFPLPMISLALVKKLELKDPNLLLVTKDEAGVRQTFIKDQRFRISRLTPLRQGQAAGSLESSAEEIRNTRMYLDALNVTHVDEVLSVILVDHDGSLAPLASTVAAGRRNIRAVRVAPEELVTKVGIDGKSLTSSPDALHLFLLGQEKISSFNLAPPAMTSGFTRLRATHGIYGAIAAAGLIAAVWCGFNFWQVVGLKDQTHAKALQTERETARYQELTRSFPPAPVSSEKLQLTVEVAQRIAGLTRLPDTMYGILSQTLGRYPNIKLNTLQWKVGKKASATGTAVPAPAASLTQSAMLELELTAQPGDYKTALANMNSFVRDIGKNEKVAEAKVVKMPLNLASSATLSGSTATPRQERPEQAQFEVELTLKPGV
jgi:hypothetical protein